MSDPRITTTATVDLPAAIDNARRYAGDAARRVKQLEADNARLREALKAADWVIEWTGADLLSGNPYSKVLASYQEYRRAALGEKE
jgi:hypothetical protein